MVQTPVGARCKDCAQMRRPPMYSLSPASLARVYGAAIGIGAAAGLLWGLLLPALGSFGFFLIFLGMAAGYGMANAIEWAGGRKRGRTVQAAAVTGIVVAYLVRNIALVGSPLIVNDIWGLVFVAVASVVAWNRLR
jgi:hypothetical protein